MSNFFRKIPKSLVVLVLVFAVYTGHAFAVEGDTPASAPDVTPSVSGDGADGFGLEDGGGSNLPPGLGGYSSITCSGADVTVNVEKHDTLSVTSVSPGLSDVSDHFVSPYAEPETPAVVETIRSLFGSYTPRTQTVITYYDGQLISTDEQIVPGLAGLDYEWLAGVGIFALMLFCLFRLLGGVLTYG